GEIETERVTAGKTACPGQRPFQGGAEHAVAAHLEGGSEIRIRDHRKCGKRKCGECLLHVMHAPQGFSGHHTARRFAWSSGAACGAGRKRLKSAQTKSPGAWPGLSLLQACLRLVVN